MTYIAIRLWRVQCFLIYIIKGLEQLLATTVSLCLSVRCMNVGNDLTLGNYLQSAVQQIDKFCINIYNGNVTVE